MLVSTAERVASDELPDPVEPPADHDRRPLVRPFIVGAVVILLLAGPLVVALVHLRDAHWYPSLELAMTELHVRDVGGRETPLTGLVGRLGTVEERGSHPGPASFVALAPVYRLAGSTPWALQLSTAVVHLVGVAVALWISRRRRGWPLLLLTAAVLTVLFRFFGAEILTQPWNPYLPLVWWVVFVLAVWSVIDDDRALLPVAVIAGSFCAQTHISYVGLVGGLTAWAALTVLGRALRRRRDRAALARSIGWLALSTAVGLALWLPPLVDLRHKPGNLTVLVDYFTGSTERAIGWRKGSQLLLDSLDPWRVLTGRMAGRELVEPSSWSVPGLLLLAAWLGSVAIAWRLRHRSLLRLHATLAIALALGAISTSRIYGVTWQWLVLWPWALLALLALAISWTAGVALHRAPRTPPVFRVAGVCGLAVVAVGSAVGLTGNSAGVEPEDPQNSRALAHLTPIVLEAVEALDDAGPDGHYLITWTDPVGVQGGFQSIGLLNELDRHGIDVGVEEVVRLRAAPRLTMNRAQATAVLHVVTGPAIEQWDAKPEAHRLARYDPLTEEQRSTGARLRQEIDDELVALGLAELVPHFSNPIFGYFAYRSDPRLPDHLMAKVLRLVRLGSPSAVFIEPP